MRLLNLRLLIITFGIFSPFSAFAKNIPMPNPLVVKTHEDYQRFSDLKDKIEILELIIEKLDPLTDNDILDSKMDNLKLFYLAIKEMQNSYENVRIFLGKFSNHKNPDIQELHQGAENFLNNQGKLLTLIARAIEKNPRAQSLVELNIPDMESLEFSIFKAMSSMQADKFKSAREKVMKEILLYADESHLKMEN